MVQLFELAACFCLVRLKRRHPEGPKWGQNVVFPFFSSTGIYIIIIILLFFKSCVCVCLCVCLCVYGLCVRVVCVSVP